ncbi:putative transcriptional regulatory protein [compost metagenome]
MLLAADAGAEDLRSEDGEIIIECPPEALEAVSGALDAAKIAMSSAEVSLVPANTVMVEDRDVAKKLVKLMNTLDDLDDVQNVTSNFDMPEALMEEFANA